MVSLPYIHKLKVVICISIPPLMSYIRNAVHGTRSLQAILLGLLELLLLQSRLFGIYGVIRLNLMVMSQDRIIWNIQSILQRRQRGKQLNMQRLILTRTVERRQMSKGRTKETKQRRSLVRMIVKRTMEIMMMINQTILEATGTVKMILQKHLTMKARRMRNMRRMEVAI